MTNQLLASLHDDDVQTQIIMIGDAADSVYELVATQGTEELYRRSNETLAGAIFEMMEFWISEYDGGLGIQEALRIRIKKGMIKA